MANESMEIERHLLKNISSSKVIAISYFHKIKDSWFTGSRTFIFNLIHKLLSDNPTQITTELFFSQLNSCFPDDNQDSEKNKYLTEWNLIQAIEVKEETQSLMTMLEERECKENISVICNNALELLKTGKVLEAGESLKKDAVLLNTNKSNNKPCLNLTDYYDIEERILQQKKDPNKFSGIKTGFEKYDKMVGGLFKSEFTLFSAVTGCGKSTLLKQLGYNIIMGNLNDPNPMNRRNGKNVLHITNEEHRDQVRLKYFSLFSGIEYYKFKHATIDIDTELKSWKQKMNALSNTNGLGKLFIKEIPQMASCSEIYKQYEELKQLGIEIDVIIIDYMDHLSPMHTSWSEFDEQAKVSFDCKGLSVDLNLSVVSATQAATQVNERQEKGKGFGKMNCYGSKRKIHACNNFIGIMWTQNDLKQLKDQGGDRETDDDCDRFWKAYVEKSRDSATFSFELRHHVKTGKVTSEEWSKNQPSTAQNIDMLDDIIKGCEKEHSNPAKNLCENEEDINELEAQGEVESCEVEETMPETETIAPRKQESVKREAVVRKAKTI